MYVAFHTTSTINNLKPKFRTRQSAYTPNGIYKLTCFICRHAYVAQTSHNLKQKYHEHIRYIKYNYPQSAYTLCGSQNYMNVTL